MKDKITTYFRFSDYRTTFKKEIIGGISTFLAMAYIIVVQPGMMSGYLPYGGVYLATLISTFVATFLMGLFARVPISLAPGMGINAFFAFTVCGLLKINVYEALSAVLVSGWLYFLIAITPLRKIIGNAFPKNLKLAIGVAIGVFIGFVGLQQSGIIQSDAFALTIEKKNIKEEMEVIIPITKAPVSVKLGNLENPLVLLAILVLFLMIILHFLKVRGAIIFSMFIGVVILLIMHLAGVDALQNVANPFQLQDFKTQFTEFGSIAGQSWTHLGAMFSNPLAYIAIFVFLYTDFFDTTGTLFAIDQAANLSQNDKQQKWLKRANIVDATGTVFGASIGSSTVTSYVESQAGIAQGARTGLAPIVTSLLFLATAFLFPIMKPLMPITNITAQSGVTPDKISPVAGPALCLVGILMLSQLKDYDWKETLDIPVLFLTILFTALTYSIASGMSVGIIAYTLLYFTTGLKNYYIDCRKNKHKPLRTYFQRLNIPILMAFVIAIVYFGTSVLYTSY